MMEIRIMEILRLYPIFCFLAQAAFANLVAPPDHLTIVCQNGTNIAYWNYSGASAAEFSVMVKSYRDDKVLLQVNTSQHHIDLSSKTPPYDKDEYTVHLTTVDGSRISNEVNVTFSYDSDLPSEVECSMDFPTVNVTVKPNWTLFSFANPISVLPAIDNDEYYYESYEYGDEQNDTLPSVKKTFYYSIYTTHDQKRLNFECSLEADVCNGQLPFKSCTTLELEGNVDRIRYRHSKNICNINPEKDRWPIYLSVVVCIIVLVSLVAFLLGTRKVIKSFLSSELPETLTQSLGSGIPRILHPEPTRCNKAGSTPLLQTAVNSPTDSQTVIPTESCLERTHFPISPPAPAPVPASSDGQLGDGYEARLQPLNVDDNGSDDRYMERERIADTTDSPDNNSFSDIVVEIADLDHASGYGPR